MNKHWIGKAINHKGSLRKALKVKKGEKIPKKKLEKAVYSKDPLLAKRARLAETLAKLRHKK
ncbi:MAG: hypothetical protein REH83_04400 [Rickettsiella sp.]|nr:hypothetical protein [Rickettsiella sp.]